MEPMNEEPRNWLRCNLCFCLMSKSTDPFSLTFCGHIFCTKCIRKATKLCPQCKVQNVPSMILQEPLKPEIKHCFESTDGLNEKLRQATLFHDMQRTLNCKRLNEVEKKYTLAKNEYHRKSKELQYLKEKLEKLLKDRETLHKQVEELESKQSKQCEQANKISFMMTPLSNVSSVASTIHSLSSSGSGRNSRQSFPIPEHLQRSVLRPMKLESSNRNAEFRVPSITKIPKSVGSSMKAFTSSSRGTPFSNYTPGSNRS